MARPDSSEHAPYYGRYVQLVPEQDILQTMTLQIETTLLFLRSLPDASGGKRYAPDKWSIKEVVGRLIDSERIFSQREFFFARNSPGPLPGYELEPWTAAAGFD